MSKNDSILRWIIPSMVCIAGAEITKFYLTPYWGYILGYVLCVTTVMFLEVTKHE